MDFIAILSIFVLACFVGYFVVWAVTPELHTYYLIRVRTPVQVSGRVLERPFGRDARQGVPGRRHRRLD